MNGWLVALRIARREARRAKGRSALVIALIGLPVLGLSFAAASYDMVRLTPEERVERLLGAADADLQWVSEGPVWQENVSGDVYGVDSDYGHEWPVDVTAERVAAVLPPGSRVAPRAYGTLRLTTATGIGDLDWEAIDLTDPLTTGLVAVTEGRAPGGAGREVAITYAAATRLGAGLGDRIDVPGSGAYTVGGHSGISRHQRGVAGVPARLAGARLPSRLPAGGRPTVARPDSAAGDLGSGAGAERAGHSRPLAGRGARPAGRDEPARHHG